MDMTPLQVSCWRVKFLRRAQSGTPSIINLYTMKQSVWRPWKSCSYGHYKCGEQHVWHHIWGIYGHTGRRHQPNTLTAWYGRQCNSWWGVKSRLLFWVWWLGDIPFPFLGCRWLLTKGLRLWKIGGVVLEYQVMPGCFPRKLRSLMVQP